MAINKQYSSLLECLPAVQEVPGSNPGRDKFVFDPLVEDGDDLG
jgi:hypothetical protein